KASLIAASWSKRAGEIERWSLAGLDGSLKINSR
ncbi:hypothetical protein ABIE32_004367, partial [Comamonas sp. 4034]